MLQERAEIQTDTRFRIFSEEMEKPSYLSAILTVQLIILKTLMGTLEPANHLPSFPTSTWA